MRRGAVLLSLVWLGAGSAAAQVTVNPGALDLLPSQPAARPAAPAREPRRPAPPPAARPTASAPAPTTAAPAPTAKPVVPTVPPAVAALPPPAPVPAPRVQATPLVPVAADAPGTATPEPGGLRVTFGPDRQDLNPTTEAALRQLARSLRDDPAKTVNVYAYASGQPEDASAARRLSLERALAGRAVLISEGVASTRIYPRALGPTGGDVDKDRMDVLVGPPGAPPAGLQPAAAP